VTFELLSIPGKKIGSQLKYTRLSAIQKKADGHPMWHEDVQMVLPVGDSASTLNVRFFPQAIQAYTGMVFE